MPLRYNDIIINKVYFNGIEKESVYFNGNIFFTKMPINNVINVRCMYNATLGGWVLFASAQYIVTSDVTVNLGGPTIATVTIPQGSQNKSELYKYHSSITWVYLGIIPSQDSNYYYKKGTITHE